MSPNQIRAAKLIVLKRIKQNLERELIEAEKEFRRKADNIGGRIDDLNTRIKNLEQETNAKRN